MDCPVSLIVNPPSMAEVAEAAARSAAPTLRRAGVFGLLCVVWLGVGLSAGWLVGGAWWFLALPAGGPLGFALSCYFGGRRELADGLARIDESDDFSAMEADLARWSGDRPDVLYPYFRRLCELGRPVLVQDYLRLRAFMREAPRETL